ncbi:hypothetical protein [Bacillus sp. REN10]|uniref:hypothetical protein n=1 Tax=Bacillus sp. REN10 TaxID=2782541 RepID=UPI00193B03C4|nr:hypothetical protein [Bacillus sp. REN10]
MKMKDHLSTDDKSKLSTLSVEKEEEKYTRRDWEEIMGTKRDTYRRVRGSVRRK